MKIDMHKEDKILAVYILIAILVIGIGVWLYSTREVRIYCKERLNYNSANNGSYSIKMGNGQSFKTRREALKSCSHNYKDMKLYDRAIERMEQDGFFDKMRNGDPIDDK